MRRAIINNDSYVKAYTTSHSPSPNAINQHQSRRQPIDNLATTHTPELPLCPINPRRVCRRIGSLSAGRGRCGGASHDNRSCCAADCVMIGASMLALKCSHYHYGLRRRARLSRLFCVVKILLRADGLIISSSRQSRRASYSRLRLTGDRGGEEPVVASLEGYVPKDRRKDLERVLLDAGYSDVVSGGGPGSDERQSANVFRYNYVKASGMLKLVEGTQDQDGSSCDAPIYIPIQRGMENVLVANGWSFLDPDESEPISAFDLDAANKEGQYKPKWGGSIESATHLSSLGYDLGRESHDKILEASESVEVTSQASHVLLKGGTDPPRVRTTNNGYDFSSEALQSQSRPPEGIFVCAIGSLPLFSTEALPPSVLSASDGWLTFRSPIAEDHAQLVHPDGLDLDQRIEVVDARTGCHLGHFFGKDGYCINASALNFMPLIDATSGDHDTLGAIGPHSWRTFLADTIEKDDVKPRAVSQINDLLRKVVLSRVEKDEILLGAGCFWHVEFALRRLPGVIYTETGYAGGDLPNPTYKDMCKGKTGHAEVVKVVFDPEVCDAARLIDCWLAMHDPTNVRAHGKRAKKTGQYRSCVFVHDDQMLRTVNSAVKACEQQLGKELSSEVGVIERDGFWAAEERHQRHDERRRGIDLNTLSFDQWLSRYGRRSAPVLGSSESIQVFDEDLDDGMARMMI
ncbi:hypothetical protein ACHAWF_004919 [Thalassiosira exigua]